MNRGWGSGRNSSCSEVLNAVGGTPEARVQTLGGAFGPLRGCSVAPLSERVCCPVRRPNESCKFTIRTERGVGLRPPTTGAGSTGLGDCASLWAAPRTDDAKVDAGAGGGGRCQRRCTRRRAGSGKQATIRVRVCVSFSAQILPALGCIEELLSFFILHSQNVAESAEGEQHSAL